MREGKLIITLCLAALIATPVMALEFEVSGHYFVEHFNHSNPNLTKDEASDDYSTMELMMKPVFKINDNITLTTQFTALQDHVWGTDASGPPSDPAANNPLALKNDNVENFDWKAAYLTIKTSIGGFIVGRYIDTPWGTPLGDSTASHGSNSRHKDRIMWVLPTGDFISGLVAQKNGEGDKGSVLSDADFHKYYGFSAYKQENWSTGLLIARYEHKNYVNQKDLRDFQTGYGAYESAVSAAQVASGTFGGAYSASAELDANGTYDAVGLTAAANANGYATATAWELGEQGSQIATATGGAIPIPDLYQLRSDADVASAEATFAGAAIADGPKRSELGLWVFNPYFMGTFGDLGVQAEILYGFGTVELDETRTYEGNTFNELDAEGLAATLDLTYDIAGFTLNAGGTYVQGDSNPDDEDTSAIGYFEESIDLEHGFLLTSDLQNLRTTLGGTDENGIPLGNVAGGPTTVTGPAGYTSFWLGAKYRVLDNLRLGLLFVNSKADDAPKTNAGVEWDDDHGNEYDFTVEWDIMNNLRFWGVIAHLDAGDYWKAGGYNAEIEDNTTFYGRLILEF